MKESVEYEAAEVVSVLAGSVFLTGDLLYGRLYSLIEEGVVNIDPST